MYSKNKMEDKFVHAEKKLLGVDKSVSSDDESDGIASELSL